MENAIDKELGLAALGRRLCNDVVLTVNDEILEGILRECSLTLLGKLYSRPNVNFQAFQSTMRQAWKSEDMI